MSDDREPTNVLKPARAFTDLLVSGSLPRGYLCPRAPHAPKFDGAMGDPAWSMAEWSAAFEDIEGPSQPHPPFDTRVKMLWDDDHLYIGAQMEEPNLWATLTEHDCVIYNDHDFEVFVDPDGDSHGYYELEVNALGTTWDLLLEKPYRDDGHADNSWEIEGLVCKVGLRGTLNDPSDRDDGWTLELAIPWGAFSKHANMPLPPRPGDRWRINFSRVEWDLEVVDGAYRRVPGRPEHNWVWSPQGVIDMHRPELWGLVEFAEAEANKRVALPADEAEARRLLYEVYWAQRALKRSGKPYVATLAELGLAELADRITMEPKADGFVAQSGVRGGRVLLRQDSRIWRENA